uniref:Stromal membrane-associated protein 2-like n=1 Tax=Pundamilia nyererei TaxID=303518 RepID=A0A3B4GYK2_9CICH
MTGKSVKDVDRYQAVLNSLLALEENKYCADCESKGPRWASWNLGIFICIRCAGIHRNLGVHISKVKSVNLDQWTQEQVQCVQEMGNAKAKRLYEAFLPECFQRPETDQAAEIFIRDKYEKKKYMDKVIDIQMLRVSPHKQIHVFVLKKDVSPKTDSQSVTDLLGLGILPYAPAPAEFLFAYIQTDFHLCLVSVQSVSSTMPQSRVTASVPENLSLFLDAAPKAEEGTVKKLSKDSILSLYASTPSVHASTGLYMNQMGYPTHPYGPYHSLAQAGGMGGTMMTSQMAMMGQQQSGVMAPSGVVPSPYMTGMMGHGMMGQQQQVGGLPALPQQQTYGVQQAQQLQWNISQMTQHMAGMNLYNTSGMMGYSDQQMGGSAAPSSAHMTAHVWK